MCGYMPRGPIVALCLRIVPNAMQDLSYFCMWACCPFLKRLACLSGQLANACLEHKGIALQRSHKTATLSFFNRKGEVEHKPLKTKQDKTATCYSKGPIFPGLCVPEFLRLCALKQNSECCEKRKFCGSTVHTTAAVRSGTVRLLSGLE